MKKIRNSKSKLAENPNLNCKLISKFVEITLCDGYVIQRLLFLIIMYLILPGAASLKAQAFNKYWRTGWKSYSAPVNMYQNIHYSDSTRASVKDIVTQINGKRIYLDASHYKGKFNIGDRVLIIQMATGAGTNHGRFEETIVTDTGTGSGVKYILVDTLERSYFPNTSTCVDCRLQVLKIPTYYRLNLETSLECHPWDGFTGGICCLQARVLYIKQKGRIAAGGKGYFDSIILGNGGNGGYGDTTYTNAGGGFSELYTEQCVLPAPSLGNETPGSLGSNGEGLEVYSIGQNGSNTSGIHFKWPGNYNDTILTMGNAGGFLGSSGGKGAEGGGHGGMGGNSGFGVTGDSGTIGTNGGKGGVAGRSGRGGGLILIKADTLLIHPDIICNMGYAFWVNGEVGKDGGAGKNGGNGGTPGLGGLGQQTGTHIYYSGGRGGFGKPGKGGNGGTAGAGGQVGTISLSFNHGETSDCVGPNMPIEYFLGQGRAINLEENFSGKGGIGGKRGIGERRFAFHKNFTISSPYDSSLCSGGGPGNDWKDSCDCNFVFKQFPLLGTVYNATSNGSSGSGPQYFYFDSLNGNGKILTIDKDPSPLMVWDYKNKIKYHCNIENSNAFYDWGNVVFKTYNTHWGYRFSMAFTSTTRVSFFDYSPTNDTFAYFEFAKGRLTEKSYSPPNHSDVLQCNMDTSFILMDSLNGERGLQISGDYDPKNYSSGNGRALFIRKGVSEPPPLKVVEKGFNTFNINEERVNFPANLNKALKGVNEANLYNLAGSMLQKVDIRNDGPVFYAKLTKPILNGIYLLKLDSKPRPLIIKLVKCE